MHDDDFEDDPNWVSKTRRKQESTDLQDLGEELIKLRNDQLAPLDLPERLLDALKEARRLTANGAIRRQRQYIGKLMREVDPVPIRALLERLANVSDEHTAWLHGLERWRERLLADDKALTLFASEHPEADVQHLRQLIRNTHRERSQNKPPKAFRELFQALKALIPEPEVPLPTSAQDEDEDDE